jgi:hypothetical protein
MYSYSAALHEPSWTGHALTRSCPALKSLDSQRDWVREGHSKISIDANTCQLFRCLGRCPLEGETFGFVTAR